MVTERTIQEQNAGQESELAKRLTLSTDPSRAMQQMMETIDVLRDIYVKENIALQSSDTPRFLEIQNEKISAVRNYHDGAQQLLERKDDLKHIDDALKQQLAEKQEEFSGIMSENLKAIQLVRKSVKRLNDRVMSSAREAAQTKNVNYGGSGKLNKNERSVSIGVSETA